jgi:hypothetical protein
MKALGSGAILFPLFLATIAWAEGPPLEANYPPRYMGSDAELITAPNGGIVYDKALEAANKVWYTVPTVDKLGDGIWVIGGYSIVNCIVIEAPEGLIVYDTGDFGEEGKHFRQIIEEKISKQPIKRSSTATVTTRLVAAPWWTIRIQ